ncbi:MAG: reverse gyrase 2 [Deltaproteobacteria bacterium]|nr:MAG: reverse gyrase 2 [Deltaproteobacteria bacterium]
MEENLKNIPLIQYLGICIIDENETDTEHILKWGFCKEDTAKFGKPFWDIIRQVSCEELKKARYFCEIEKKVSSFVKFFEENLGIKHNSLLLYWAKRVLSGQSFSIHAPPGFGKTTFGVSISHFIDGKVYYIVPTKVLCREIGDKIRGFKSGKRVLVVDDKVDKSEISRFEYDILVSTSNFLHKNFDVIPKNFNLVFIDDADSLVRQPKNIDKVLKLIGFSDEDIAFALSKHAQKDRGLLDKIKRKKRGQVVVASATLSPKTKRIYLFRELLDFEIAQSSTTFLRNVVDSYKDVSKGDKEHLLREALYFIKNLGKGAFVFLSSDFSKDELKEFVSYLCENGIRAISYEQFTRRNRDRFIEGEIEAVVGFSNIRNPLTRGIDLPQAVRYALFVGVPKYKVPLKTSYSPKRLFLLLFLLGEFIHNRGARVHDYLAFLRRLRFVTEEMVLRDEKLKNRVEPIKRELDVLLQDKAILDAIREKTNLDLKEEDDPEVPGQKRLVLLISDPRGYLQASGRTSRLFSRGLTKGFSLILVDNEKVLKHLKEKLAVMGYRIEFEDVRKLNLKEVFQKIDEDRKIVSELVRERNIGFLDLVRAALIIVESPTKSRTIASFFGKPARRLIEGFPVYEVSLGNYIINVIATVGHIADLVKSGDYYGVIRKDGYFVPRFQPLRVCGGCGRDLEYEEKVCSVCNSDQIRDKGLLISALRRLANEVQEVYLCTDPDSEGEKISFDLFCYLKPSNQSIKRIELHEITREEFLRQFQLPRELSSGLVRAQLLRRVSDRWIGFSLSEDLQRKFRNTNLSAGRVQTPVLGWIIEREEERKKKVFRIRMGFNSGEESFVVEDRNLVEELKKLFEDERLKVEVSLLGEKQDSVAPPPPYITSDLLRDANIFLKLDSTQAMELTQELFERGFITYHRTDSRYVSDAGRGVAREYLFKKGMGEFFYARSWGEKGTHECIRPTRPLDQNELLEHSYLLDEKPLSRKHLALYNLIFKRFVASQMKPAFVRKAEYKVGVSGLNMWGHKEIVSEIIDRGYLVVLPNLQEKRITPGTFKVLSLLVRRVSKEQPFTEGSLIEEMKKRGLGRPSTYALILRTLKERGYVVSKNGLLFPTHKGFTVYQYLSRLHRDLVSEDFTRVLEEQMDMIEEGKADYQMILKELFERIFLKRAAF